MLLTRVLAKPLDQRASIQRVEGELEHVAQIVPRPRVLAVVDCHRLVGRLCSSEVRVDPRASNEENKKATTDSRPFQIYCRHEACNEISEHMSHDPLTAAQMWSIRKLL